MAALSPVPSPVNGARAIGTKSWILGVYRATRSDEVVQLLNDLGWVLIFTPVVAGLLQVFMLGIAVFNSRAAPALFPRWFGFFNIWIGVAFLPGGLLAFFKTGPFAWNGLFCFWLGLSAFGLWFVVTAVMLLKAER